MKRLGAYLLLLIIIICFKEGILQSRKCKKGYAANEKILVIISFDGLRGDYINSTTTPYLAKLRDMGARTNFWTLKFPNALNVHHTIATGAFPKQHGVVSHEWFERRYPNLTRKLQTYEKSQYENIIAKKNKIYPIWTVNDLNGGTSACMMWPGCEFNYGPDNTHPTYTQEFSADQTYESRLQQIITWMNESATFNPPNLVMIYFHQPDHFAHVYGPNSSKIIPKLKELDEFTKNFTDKLKQLPFTRLNKKLFPYVNIVFVSDHRLTQIFYEDILDIPAQGVCTDVKFYGTDVWLQHAYDSRENNSKPKLSAEFSCFCDNPYDCYNRGYYDVFYLDSVIKYDIGEDRVYVYNCWYPIYERSKCVKSMCCDNLPANYKLINSNHRHNRNGKNSGSLKDYVDFPDSIANFTIFLADVNHTWTLKMDERQKLVFAAYGEKLYPKIDAWRKKYNFDVNECTKFGVHGYSRREVGYFIAIGPAFVKKLESRGFNAVDLYSLFCKVLGFPKIENRSGNFDSVKHLLIITDPDAGTGLINWIQHLRLIVICSIIHCAVFYIAVEIYLVRRGQNIV